MVRAVALLLFALSLIWQGNAARAAADCLACAKTDTTPENLKPIDVEIRSQLDFSRAVASSGGGVVKVDPVTGARQVSGNVVDLGGTAFAGSAIVTGEPGRPVRIDMPTKIVMKNAQGGEIEISNIRSNLPPAPKLDGFGKLEFAFGGDLVVRGNVTGTFRGRIPITAQYE